MIRDKIAVQLVKVQDQSGSAVASISASPLLPSNCVKLRLSNLVVLSLIIDPLSSQEQLEQTNDIAPRANNPLNVQAQMTSDKICVAF